MESVDALMQAQLVADRCYADFERQVSELARSARSLEDVGAVADRVHLLRLHRPRICDVLASADADGRNFVEHGFAVGDGFVGTADARVLCIEHRDLTPWPCPDVVATFGEPATATPSVSV